MAPTIGPALGGWLTDVASWHWCFFINIPLGAIAGFIVYAFLHDTEAARGDEPVDWAGVGLLVLGLGTLQYVLEEGERNDWLADPSILRLSVISALSLLALAIWQLSPRNTHPVMNLRVLKNGSLTAGIILFVSVGFGLYGVSYLYPLLAQTVQGMTAHANGYGDASRRHCDGRQHRFLRRHQQRSQIQDRRAGAHPAWHRLLGDGDVDVHAPHAVLQHRRHLLAAA